MTTPIGGQTPGGGETPQPGAVSGSSTSPNILLVDEESEFTRLKKEESLSKLNILGDMPRIIKKNDLDSLIVQQITTILFRFEMLLA